MKLADMYRIAKEDISPGDYILIDYDLFFSDDIFGMYTRFSIDEKEDIEFLRGRINNQLSRFKETTLYICVYGDELVDNNGCKFIYGDSIWINSCIDIAFMKTMFDDHIGIQPSAVRILSDMDEINQKRIFCFKNNGTVVDLVQSNVIQEFRNTIVFYWD